MRKSACALGNVRETGRQNKERHSVEECMHAKACAQCCCVPLSSNTRAFCVSRTRSRTFARLRSWSFLPTFPWQGQLYETIRAAQVTYVKE